MKMVLLYIAGPYSAPTQEGIEENVKAAQKLGAELMTAFPGKVLAVVPHSIGKGLEDRGDYKFWCAATLELMKRCDGVVLRHNWHNSPGALGEVDAALRLRMPIVVESENLFADLQHAFGGTL